jgi:hypothetical protein
MKNKFFIVLLPLIIMSVFLIAPIHSAELDPRWKYYATDGLKGKHYYDTKSIVRGTTLKVWEIEIGGSFKECRWLREINCTTRECRLLQGTVQYEDNLNIASKRYNEPTIWESIEPETWMETLYDILCNKKVK